MLRDKKVVLSVLCVLLLASCVHKNPERAKPAPSGEEGLSTDEYYQQKTALLQQLEANPDDTQTYIFLGLLSFRAGFYIEARNYYINGLRLESDPEKRHAYKVVIDSEGSYFRSQEEAAQNEKAHHLIKAGKPAEAVAAAQAAIELNPANALHYYEAGYACIELGDIEKAMDYLEKGHARNPVHDSLAKELKYCYAHLGLLKKSIDLAEVHIIIHGPSPMILSELAYTYANADMPDESLATLARAQKEFPDYPITYLYLAQYYAKDNRDTKRAISHLRYFLSLVEGKTVVSGDGFVLSEQIVRDATAFASQLLASLEGL